MMKMRNNGLVAGIDGLAKCDDPAELLNARQKYPLGAKVNLTKLRIKEWYEHFDGNVHVAFSGGKDSTALLHMVRSMYPEVPAVFADTGLEFPEIRDFVKSTPNVIWVAPEMTFREVLDKHGFAVVSKRVAEMIRRLRNPTGKNENTLNLIRTGVNKNGKKMPRFKLPNKWKFLVDAPFKISEKCCDVFKKNPMKGYIKKTGSAGIIGTMAEDSMMRRGAYLAGGCNSFSGSRVRSVPMSFWLEHDVWDYLKENNVPYCSVYDKGQKNTGCVFCLFGCYVQDRREERFDKLKETHPQLYSYCMDKLGIRKVFDFMREGLGIDKCKKHSVPEFGCKKCIEIMNRTTGDMPDPWI